MSTMSLVKHSGLQQWRLDGEFCGICDMSVMMHLGLQQWSLNKESYAVSSMVLIMLSGGNIGAWMGNVNP